MKDKLESLWEVIETAPSNLYACFLVACGCMMYVFHKDASGQSLIAAGLAIFKGKA